MLSDDNSSMTRKISALAGLLAAIAAIALGCIFLVFALPSLGQPGEFDYFFSQAAGGFLIVLLGLLGIFAAALAWQSRRTEQALILLGSLFSLCIFAALAFYREWTACAIIILFAAITWVALHRRKDAARNLFLFAGLFGFPLAQASITLLPYGWKTWSISGVLFLFSALFLSLSGHFAGLPLLSRGGRRRWGHLLYALLCLALIVLAISVLLYLPGPAGPGPAGNLAKSGLSENGAAGQIELNDSDLDNNLRAVILYPGDVRTYPSGETVLFSAASCKKEPCSFLWRSSQDGIIGNVRSFETKNLSVGWHNITLAVTNSSGSLDLAYIELGIAEPWVCGGVNPRPKYYPPDTPCQEIWPDAPVRCQENEVCHPGLDWIVAEAVDCCDGSPLAISACSDACNQSGGDRKKCRGIFIINSFGPDARYMRGYALFKTCCSGYPECTRMCGSSLAGTCTFMDGYNENVSHLSCRPEEWGVSAWHSDTNMSENSAVLGLFPTHATVNILKTGVCSDYSAALTTMLRKAGYNKSEAFSTSSSAFDLPFVGDHPGHAFNLVLLPGDTKYHIVDTTGNGDGINLDGVPGYFRFTGCFLGMPSQTRIMDWWMGYCKMISPQSYNDAGNARTPEKKKICGCT